MTPNDNIASVIRLEGRLEERALADFPDQLAEERESGLEDLGRWDGRRVEVVVGAGQPAAAVARIQELGGVGVVPFFWVRFGFIMAEMVGSM